MGDEYGDDELGGNLQLDLDVGDAKYGEEALTVEMDEPQAEAGTDLKRKRDEADQETGDEPPKKKKKKKKKKKGPGAEQQETAVAAGMDPDVQAVFWHKFMLLSVPNVAEDAQGEHKGSSFVDVSALGCPREAKHLVPALRKLFPDQGALRMSKKWKTGQPRVLVVSPAATGVLAFTKALLAEYSPQSGVRVAKLFARHIKLQEQVEQMRAAKVSVAVGTPLRILQLSEAHALDVSKLQVLMVDMQKNVKSQTIFDMKDTRAALYRLYCESPLHKQVLAGTTRIVLF